MTDNPGDLMNVLLFMGIGLFLLAAGVSVIVKRWKIRTIAQRRQRVHEALRARQHPATSPMAATDFVEVDRRIEAVFAELNDFRASQR